MPSIRHLCLTQCHNTKEALSRFVTFNKNCMRLRRLNVTLSRRLTCILNVLRKLQCLTHLTSLQLLLRGESNRFSLKGILLSRRSLRHLFLKSRYNVSDPTTAHPYQVQEFLKITESCCFLKTLSISINMSQDSLMMLVNYSRNRLLLLYWLSSTENAQVRNTTPSLTCTLSPSMLTNRKR